MTKTLLSLVVAFSLPSLVQAQDAKPAEKPATPGTAAKETSAKPQLSAEELESKFKAMLSNATLSGRWAPIKDGALGEEKSDTYQIVSVGKISGDNWVVNARIKMNQREFVAPLPVKVIWAGDTPVLIVDKMTMPGGKNAYSARVIFFENTYAGNWSGGDHGGMLYGTITNEKASKPEETK